MQALSAVELAAWLSEARAAARQPPVLLDVREPWEVQTCHLEGSLSMPMRDVPARLAELDPDASIVCICHHGARSLQVAHFLEQQGVRAVFNLSGGLDAWHREVDASFPRY